MHTYRFWLKINLNTGQNYLIKPTVQRHHGFSVKVHTFKFSPKISTFILIMYFGYRFTNCKPIRRYATKSKYSQNNSQAQNI